MSKTIFLLIVLFAYAHAYTCPDLTDIKVFPDDNWWNWDVTSFETHPDSDKIVETTQKYARPGLDHLHPDYGAKYGIPYCLAGKDSIEIRVADTKDSDLGPHPIPLDSPVEGLFAYPKEEWADYGDPQQYLDPKGLGGDKHVLAIDKEKMLLYELFDALPQPSKGPYTHWTAAGAFIWDLKKNQVRMGGQTSADAAGLPIFPGLVRYDEVAKGEIKHAIRCTVDGSLCSNVFPATHMASNKTDKYLPPMGMRFRIKKDYDISGFSKINQVVLTALKKYGMIVADNGGTWFITGAPDDRWKDEDIQEIKKVKYTDIEVVKTFESNKKKILPSGINPKIEISGKKKKRK